MTAPEDPRLQAVRDLCDNARQVMWPAAKGYPAGWTLDPAAVLAALSVAPQPQPATCKHGRAAKHFIPRGTVGAWGEWCPGPVSAAAPEQL